MRTPDLSRRLLPLALLTAAALAAACGRGASPTSLGSAEERAQAQRAVGMVAPAAADMAMKSDVAASPSPPTPSLGSGVRLPSDTATLPSMIIRNGNASVLVDSLDRAIAGLRALAGQLGGYVANTQVQSGAMEIRSATLELKLPAPRFDAAVNGLDPLGKVESVNTTAEDVGEEFVDVTARVTNARRLETRLVELLAQRTGKLEDVLAVERELARVREEIERYEGRLRFLRSRVALSTLSVTVHEAAPLVSANPGQSVMLDAFRGAWRNFVRFIAALIESLGWAIPLALLVAAVLWGVLRIVRRSRPPRLSDGEPAPRVTET